MKLERKSDHIKILESDSAFLSRKYKGSLQCINCKERYELVELKTDDKNLFCKNCGHLTPKRTVKHGRGLTGPGIQDENTGIAQAKNYAKVVERKPAGLTKKKKNEIEEWLINKGFQVTDSYTIEPTP